MSGPIVNNRVVDQTALKVNQVSIIGLLLLAFLFDLPWLMALVAAVMVVGTMSPRLSLFKQLYGRVLKPAGLLRPRPQPDNPEPHRFAQGFGGTVVTAGTLALFAGVPPLGWALAWLVIGLAALNLLLGFCAGCFVYYQLSRRGVPGFDRQPISPGPA